jgi:rRNA maturation endonuclease Nob1
MICDSCGWISPNVSDVSFCPSCGEDRFLRVLFDAGDADPVDVVRVILGYRG